MPCSKCDGLLPFTSWVKSFEVEGGPLALRVVNVSLNQRSDYPLGEKEQREMNGWVEAVMAAKCIADICDFS